MSYILKTITSNPSIYSIDHPNIIASNFMVKSIGLKIGSLTKMVDDTLNKIKFEKTYLLCLQKQRWRPSCACTLINQLLCYSEFGKFLSIRVIDEI